MTIFGNSSRTGELDEAIKQASSKALDYLNNDKFATMLKAHDNFDRLSDDMIYTAQEFAPSYVVALCQIIFKKEIVDGNFTGLKKMPERKLMGILNVKFYDAFRNLLTGMGNDARTATRLSKQIVYGADLYTQKASQLIIDNASVIVTNTVLSIAFLASVFGELPDKSTPEMVTLLVFINEIAEEVQDQLDPSYR